MVRTFFLGFICLVNINVCFAENNFDTLCCKVLYNDYEHKKFSLHFDGGDQLFFTPNFFLLQDSQLTDTGFIYTDTLESKLLNDSNYILLFSKRAQRHLQKSNHPAKNKYNGLHFYLFEATIIVEKKEEIKLANWPAPSNKYGSEYKIATIRNIKKIIKLTPVKSKRHRFDNKNRIT